MEKILENILYDTSSMQSLAHWGDALEHHVETLYFSDNGKYLLHSEGEAAKLSNMYGTESFGKEDLFFLELDDVIGWLDVHAPKKLKALFPKEDAGSSAVI